MQSTIRLRCYAYRAKHDTASPPSNYVSTAFLLPAHDSDRRRDFAPGPVIDARIDGALRRKSAAPQAYLRKQIAAANINTMR